MSDVSTNRSSSGSGPRQYEIRVRGHLEPRWAIWFGDMTLTRHADGTTVIRGPVTDQSALQGLLRKLNDIGLPLVSVTPTSSQRPAEPTTARTTHPASPTQTRRSTT